MNTDLHNGAAPDPADEPALQPDEHSADSVHQYDSISATDTSANATPRLRSIRRRARSLSRSVDTSTSMDFHGTVYIEGDVVGQNKNLSSADKGPDRLLVLSMLRPLARPPFLEAPRFAS